MKHNFIVVQLKFNAILIKNVHSGVVIELKQTGINERFNLGDLI